MAQKESYEPDEKRIAGQFTHLFGVDSRLKKIYYSIVITFMSQFGSRASL